MKIIWFTWKDRKNPLAGGAEVVNEELCKRLVLDKNEVIIITAGFRDSTSEEVIDGYKVIRVGGRWSVYWQAYKYYKKHLVGWADLVIDEMNTVPFFCKYYVKEKNIMFVHQLCHEIWFYQMPWIVAVIGYLAEAVYLRLLNDLKIITVSESTKNDLMCFGFKAENISIISEGIEIEPVKDLAQIKKYDKPTILAFGSIRPMKRTHHVVKAFELAKKEISALELLISGDSSCSYGQKVLQLAYESFFSDSIKYLGRVSREKKIELMQKAHLLCVTSVKEGWGLVVTEANSQGTPAIVYDVDGLRDSVLDDKTGIVCKDNTPNELAYNIVRLVKDQLTYKQMQSDASYFAKKINFEGCYIDFKKVVNRY